jgi:hypothetical protein
MALPDCTSLSVRITDIKDYYDYVTQERGRLASSALAILKGFHLAGRPSQTLTPWGSFDEWSDLVRQAVVWVGLPDPGETRIALAEHNDTDGALLQQLLTGWAEADPGLGLTAAEALELLDREQEGLATLRAAVNEIDGAGGKKHALGNTLKRFRRRIMGGRYFDRVGRGNTKVWTVKRCA